jgi:hypothetical protein
MVQAREGHAAEAVAMLRKALDLQTRGRSPSDPPSPLGAYSIGCYHALLAGLAADPASGLTAAEGRAEADQAMDYLRKAVAGGMRDAASYRSSPSLKALRDRADFRQLLKDLEKPSEAFPP